VSIIIAVKRSKSNTKVKPLAHVHHNDLFGTRERKYDYLQEHTLAKTLFNKLHPSAPFYMLLPRDEKYLDEYQAWPCLTDIMKTNVLGFQSHRDEFAVDFQKNIIKRRIEDLRDGSTSDSVLRDKYGLKDNRDWQLASSRNDLRANNEWKKAIIECAYRPFDNRYCYFSYAAMDYPRRELLDHVAWRENICLLVSRQQTRLGSLMFFYQTKSLNLA
jgi:hypothetical protein